MIQMNHWMKRGLQAAVLIGGFWVIGAGIASAETSSPATDTGLQASVTAPVDVSGNAVSILGSGVTPATTPATGAAATTTARNTKES